MVSPPGGGCRRRVLRVHSGATSPPRQFQKNDHITILLLNLFYHEKNSLYIYTFYFRQSHGAGA